MRTLPTPADRSAPDRLSSLLERFRVQAALFHSGPLCGRQVFEPQPGRAFLHILRQGEMEVRHPDGDTALPRLKIDTPSLLLYPQPLHHVFFNSPLDGPDFTCATLDFDGGARNPIVQSLPPVMVVPLAAISELEDTLHLLFTEADLQRCGSRLLTNRLFEVALIQVLRWVVDHPDAAGVSHGLMRGLSDARLARTLVAMHQAPQDEWTLPRMASTAGMSRSAFAAVFKEVMQATPASYLLDWRLSLACAQLRAGVAVKQVAIEVGFADTASLSKAFRKRLGASPRAWLAATAAQAG
ncbi:AraC family transcriptional regulator [Stenotrophomonas maltophilia]|uniref:AraC family transcriptional regulator n=1 Tax=Stenotrophomonas maltophilia TaxID=40324 RepID=A0ABD7BYD8_STEMA|nr:AraC family transcriptional regulator [Stenotrophomonas maltophilia]QQQ40579.1 AraC family transcriptional regulator [Stenotrophomonas maltophilia]